MAKKLIYSSSNDWHLEGAEVTGLEHNEKGNLVVLLEFTGRDGARHTWHFTPAYNGDLLERKLDEAFKEAEKVPDTSVVYITCGYAGGRMEPIDLWVDDGLD